PLAIVQVPRICALLNDCVAVLDAPGDDVVKESGGAAFDGNRTKYTNAPASAAATATPPVPTRSQPRSVCGSRKKRGITGGRRCGTGALQAPHPRLQRSRNSRH